MIKKGQANEKMLFSVPRKILEITSLSVCRLPKKVGNDCPR